MTNKPINLNQEQRARWQQSVRDLGLSPDLHAHGEPVVVATHELNEFKSWFSLPPHPEERTNRLSADRIRTMEDLPSTRMIQDHVVGRRVLDDSQALEIDRRQGSYLAEVLAAEDIEITEDKPLIIDGQHVVVTFGVVRINGGYIRITAPTHFQCQKLIKEKGSRESHDVFIMGDDGDPGEDGENGTPFSGAASRGTNGSCGCCSSNPVDGGDGHDGRNGEDGHRSPAGGARGEHAPDVRITIYSELASTISVLNQGGKGGDGGHGGDGANGQQGGRGGAQACNKSRAGSGGDGGNGGNGGNGTNGGDGGNGAEIFITYPASSSGSVTVRNGEAEGGRKGPGGRIGRGGQGGNSGEGRGGFRGEKGTDGSSSGNDGEDGRSGSKGLAHVNGDTIR